MKALKVRVSVGVTVNLGNFESLKIAYDVEVGQEEGDKVLGSIDAARKMLTDKIRKDLADSEGGKKYLMK